MRIGQYENQLYSPTDVQTVCQYTLVSPQGISSQSALVAIMGNKDLQ